MDLSVKKEAVAVVASEAPASKSMEVFSKSEGKKSLSFSVERLLKGSKNEESSSKSEAAEAQIVSSAASSIISTPCLATATLPIRPLVAPHPNSGSLSLLQSFYVPAMYSHQVLVRPPDLFGPGSAASFLSLPNGSHHVHHHLNPMGNGKRKKSWTRAVFSHLQRKGLEKRFQMQKYITKPDRRQLAASLGLTDAQVKVWFQNRRMKWRHMESKERREQEKQAQAQQAAVGSSRPVGGSTEVAQGGNPTPSSSVSGASSSSAPRLPSNFPPFLHPSIHNHSAAHLSAAAAAAAAASTNSTFFYEDEEDSNDDDEEEDDDEDEPRLVMNADSTGDPEDIKVD